MKKKWDLDNNHIKWQSVIMLPVQYHELVIQLYHTISTVCTRGGTVQCRGAFATAVVEWTHSNFFSETYFRSTTLYWKIDNALLPASVPRHPPLAVSLFTGTTMKESDNLSLCLLPFHDTRPLFVLTLLAGTAIKETERWVETARCIRICWHGN